jgi:decaprenylphospho-beta-D-erythro-pentofuranosid-2-ulose 2-reductase
MTKNIVIFGATSAIAHAVAREYAQKKANFILVGRSEDKLNSIKNDLVSYGAESASTMVQDLNDCTTHPGILEQSQKKLGKIDLVFIAHGILGNQDTAEKIWSEAKAIIDANYTSQVSLGLAAGEILKTQKSGTIAIVGSVAGDRGRQSNFIYGSAKAGIHAFCSGLRNRLYPFGVNVLTIKPGIINTPMTANLKRGLIWAEPSSIAPVILNAIEARKSMIYTPWFWKWIMLIIKSIPESIFVKLKT